MSREEALFVGWSCGSAVHGALEYAREHLTEKDTMVIILPDHGTRYLNKIYNDDWMKSHGYLEAREFATAKDIVKTRQNQPLITVKDSDTLAVVVNTLNKKGISQLVVVDKDNQIVGSLLDNKLLQLLIANPEAKNTLASEVMDKPFLFVGLDNTVDALSSLINKDNRALLVRDLTNEVHIITEHDLLQALSK